MESNLDGSRGHPEHLRRLRCAELFDVTQDEHDTVVLRQAVDGVAHLGADLLPLQKLVGTARGHLCGPDPQPVAVELRKLRIDQLFGLPLARPQSHQAGIHQDAVQPGSEPRLALEAIDGAEGGEERVLEAVASLLLEAHQPSRHGQERASVDTEQLAIRVVFARPEPREERRLPGGSECPDGLGRRSTRGHGLRSCPAGRAGTRRRGEKAPSEGLARGSTHGRASSMLTPPGRKGPPGSIRCLYYAGPGRWVTDGSPTLARNTPGWGAVTSGSAPHLMRRETAHTPGTAQEVCR